MKIFISHKREDGSLAKEVSDELTRKSIPYYLDILDSTIVNDGKALTEHIKKELSGCTDNLVVMTAKTLSSQWVPFEVGMSAQIDMSTVTYLRENVNLPMFLQYWPCLRKASDIGVYIDSRVSAARTMQARYGQNIFSARNKNEIELFYSDLKTRLGQK